ncbi:uncharacterized protein LOC106668966 isoform X2 [Cimex lectularius]|uniref:Uncharacterized protein n=1 Tax=Cimex lectularius TaxID=79782 RepID=A0A8I6RWK1_CIMLE|nr:uncharacterized protein LOC106668966 isoform X2 [Cimex lectularius]
MENCPKKRYCVSRIVDSIKNMVVRKNANKQKSNPKKAGLKIKLGKIENGYLLESDYKQLNSLFVPGKPMFGYDYDLLSHVEVSGLKLDSGHEVTVEGVLPVVKLSQTRTDEGKTIKIIHIKGRFSRKCPLAPRVRSDSFMRGTRLRKNGTLFRPPVTISELRNRSTEQKEEEKKINVQFTQTCQSNVCKCVQNSPVMVDKRTSMNIKTVQIPNQYDEDNEGRNRFRKKRRPTGSALSSNGSIFSTTEKNNSFGQVGKRISPNIKSKIPDQYDKVIEMAKQFRNKKRPTGESLVDKRTSVNNETVQMQNQYEDELKNQFRKKKSSNISTAFSTEKNNESFDQMVNKSYIDAQTGKHEQDRIELKKSTPKSWDEDSKKIDPQNLMAGNESEKEAYLKKAKSHGYFNMIKNHCNISHDWIKESSNLNNTDMVETSKNSHYSINSNSEYKTVNSAESLVDYLLFFNNNSQELEKEEKEENSLTQETKIHDKIFKNITETSSPPKSITITRSKKRYITLSNGEELVEKTGDEILTVDTSNGDHQIVTKENVCKFPNNIFTSDDYFNKSDFRLDEQLSWLEKLTK